MGGVSWLQQEGPSAHLGVWCYSSAPARYMILPLQLLCEKKPTYELVDWRKAVDEVERRN